MLAGEDEPAVGALVRAQDSGQSAITDVDGGFSIVAEENDVLTITYIGYADRTIQVDGQSNIQVSMQTSALIDDVVVTAFGIEKDERSLGYAVQEVDMESIDKAGFANPFEALQGRVSGLQVSKTAGDAGGGVDMLIRGISSVNPSRSNQPLIIVDGLTMNNDTFSGDVLPSAGSNASGSSEQYAFTNRAADINPEDIATVNVLKGAAATALYGIRASNGAIVITTKKGVKGKPRVAVNLSTALRNVVQEPALQTTFREGHRTTKYPAYEDPANPGSYIYPSGFSFYSWGVPYTDDSFTLPGGEVIDLSNDSFTSPYDLFKTGVNYGVNVNLSGANDWVDYTVSLGRNQDSGIVPNTDNRKNSLRLKGGFQVNDQLRITPSIALTETGGLRGAGGDKSIFSSLSYWTGTFDINDYLTPGGDEKNYSNGIVDNPRYLAEIGAFDTDVFRSVLGATVNYEALDWLDLTYQAQIDRFGDDRNRFVPGNVDVGTQVNGFVINEEIDNNDFESNFLARASHTVSEDLSGTFTLGHQVSNRKRDYDRVYGQGLIQPFVNDISNTTSQSEVYSLLRQREVGVFGELNIDYKDLLYVSLTGRNDWISTMPADNRSFFYPSASLAYLFSENIDPTGEFLSFGKLRASYAQVGKGPGFGQVGRYFIKDNSNFPWTDNGDEGFRFGTSEGDVNLSPERSNSYEIGADLRFLNNRIRFDYTYYKNKVNDQIFRVGSAYSSGLSGNVRNAGDFELWGHELHLGGQIIKSGDFRVVNKAKVGDALGSLYSWVFQTTPSGARYVGPDGKWVVTGSGNNGFFDGEQVKVGNAFPDFVLSNAQSFKYKDFALNFLLEWKKGGDLYDRGRRNAIRNGNLLMTEFRDQDRILAGEMDDGSGGFTANTIPLNITANSYYRDFNNYNTAAEILLQDGSWVKLRNIGLGYSLPQAVASSMKMRRAAINVSANNLILWTPFDGFDPEGSQFSAGSNIYGYTGLSTPLPQTYSFGLNLEF